MHYVAGFLALVAIVIGGWLLITAITYQPPPQCTGPETSVFCTTGIEGTP